MAATELDEESWLYGDGYAAKSKSAGGVNEKQPEDKGRSGSPLLDDLDDVIANAEMKQRTNKIVSVSSSLKPKATTPSEDAKIPVEDEDGVFDTEKREGEEKAVGEGEEEEEEESESDEDDVQIVIGPIENHPVPFYPGRLPSTSNAVLTGPKKVDVEAVPTIGGQSLFEIDLDSADKPWRLPGADITDYFNYGFTEETWRLYCEKQRRTKTEVAQLNKIAVHTTRISTLQRSGMVTAFSTIPSITGSSLPPPHMHPFSLPHAGLLPPTLLRPPPLPHLPPGILPPVLPEPPSSSQDSSAGAHGDQHYGNKTPEPANEREEGSEGRATPGVDQETPEVLPPTGKVPLLPPPPTSLAPPPFSMPPPIRGNMSSAADVNAMAAMLSGLRHPEHHFPGFLPPPGFPPPFHPQLPGGDFRHRVPPFPGGPPPFPMLPGGHLDVPGLLPPPLDERGLPIHPDLGLPGGTWDPSMGPPELFDMMTHREDYARGTRSPSRSGSSGRSRSRSRSSSYDDRGRRRREKKMRRHSRSRSHSRDRDRDRHRSSRRSHHSNHHRSERHDRDRDRDRERDKEREREREKERERRRREERSRRERSRRHRSSSRDREEDRGSAGGSRSTRDRKTKEPPPPRDERSHSRTPP